MVKKKGNKRSKKEKLVLLLMVVFVSLMIFLVMGIYIGVSFSELGFGVEEISEVEEKIDFSVDGVYETRMLVPAVDNNGKGSVGVLKTTIREGSGLVLVNINDVLAGVNTQQSSRTAVKVASVYTNQSFENIDIIYNMEVNASFIEGPSAGGAMAVSLISLIEQRELNPKVSITGGLKDDGTLDVASGISQKADALKKAGIELMILSEKTPLEDDYLRKTECIETNNEVYCEVRQIKRDSLDISGLKVIRTSELKEVLDYFYDE